MVKNGTRLAQGRSGEQLALQYLLLQGFVLLGRNLYTRFGEIDLVVRRRNEIHFVEVRTRSKPDFGPAVESVSPTKQGKLKRTAFTLLDTHPDWKKCIPYFSVIGIDVLPGQSPSLEFIPDAF